MPKRKNAGNQQLFESLLGAGRVRLSRGPLFDQTPEALPANFEFDKIEGMMLGLAIGDGLGITSEGLLPSERRRRHGEIRHYIPNRYVNIRKGFPSDDTQLAFWTLEQMLLDEGFDPDHVADCFCHRHIFGIGSTVREFLRNRNAELPWYECGPKSAGNGALMRIAPILIPYLRAPSPNLWVDTALAASLTHNDAGSTACCLAFVNILWHLLRTKRPYEPQWWLETFVALAKDLEGDTKYRPRGGLHTDYEGPIWRFVEEKVGDAWNNQLSILEAGKGWYSGAFLLETMPSVIYILMRHADDPEEAIVRAVNDTKDNDTIAAIVGAAVGALHGKKGLPPRWVEDLSGRTTDSDDGRVFKLLVAAQENWFGTSPNSARPVLLMVQELHSMGYERLRIGPGMAPSGCHWRCSIAPTTKFGRNHGAIVVNRDKDAVHYSTGQGFNYFGWTDASGDTPRQMAEKFLARFSNLAELGRGQDEAYARWFREMLAATSPGGVVYAYADWDYPLDCLSTMGVEPEVTIPLPPPGEEAELGRQ